MLPIVAPLARARARGLSLSDLVATLPPRFTAADRLQGIAPETSAALLQRLTQDAAARTTLFDDMGPEHSVDLTDGLRVTFRTGDIVHLRPSGNAPEFRVYAEAGTRDRAEHLAAAYLKRIKEIA